MNSFWHSTLAKLHCCLRPSEFKVGLETVNIQKLISPLRFDVIVRKNFFEMLANEEELYRTDFDRFMDKTEQSDYFVWFEMIYCVRFHPELLQNHEARKLAFQQRVRKSADLFFSFREAGFRKDHQIVLRSGRVILPSDSGKSVLSNLFVGDGCHRIALLLMNGTAQLEPSQYRIKIDPRHTPLDNTIILLPSLRLPESAYAAFISWAFCDVEHFSLKSLREAVKRNSPQRMEELCSITERDMRFLKVEKA